MKHEHGGNIREAAEIYGINEKAIIDFSANINPLGMSRHAKEAILKALDGIVNYPDTKSARLVKALSDYHGIAEKNILTGNGATELIYLIARTLKPRKALIVAPAFSEYERSLNVAGCKVDHFILKNEEDFKLDVKRLCEVMKQGYEALWLGNPANPTGALVSRKDLLKIAEISEGLQITFVVDEAFIDFCEDRSIKDQVQKFKNLIVLRSMTKFFALAGLRTGYLFTHNNFIQKLLECKEPWSMNSLGQEAAIASLDDEPYIKETENLVCKERDYLTEEIARIPVFKVFETHANYLLLKMGNGVKSKQVREWLLKEHHLLIRDCSNYSGLDERFIRVAVKKRGENQLLVEALKQMKAG